MAPRIVQMMTGALICSFVLLPLWAVWRQADGTTSFGPADWSALRFTILQATLSALLSTYVRFRWLERLRAGIFGVELW